MAGGPLSHRPRTRPGDLLSEFDWTQSELDEIKAVLNQPEFN